MINQSIIQAAEQCLNKEVDAIKALIPRLDDNFVKVIQLIHDCKGKVVVTGVGKSGHIGSKIAATLASTGTPAFFLNPLDAYHGDLGMIGTEDVVLAISYSGATEELLRFLPLSRSPAATTSWTISRSRRSPRARRPWARHWCVCVRTASCIRATEPRPTLLPQVSEHILMLLTRLSLKKFKEG